MKPALFFVAAICALLLAETALAHTVGLSNGEYVLTGQTLQADVSMSQRELAAMLPEIDLDHDGQLDPDELAAASAALTRSVVGGVSVTADGATCAGALDRAWVLEGEGGLVVRARYSCPHLPTQLTLALPILARLSPGHRQLARIVIGGKGESVVLDREHSSWSRDLTGGPARATGIFWSMLELGVEHILTGADHLVFLIGLVIVGGRFRSLVGVVSAFTVAHSITLALAALNVVSPSPRIVEPAIALSIA